MNFQKSSLIVMLICGIVLLTAGILINLLPGWFGFGSILIVPSGIMVGISATELGKGKRR